MGKDSPELKEKLEALDIEKVMSTENGRRFIWRILTYCGVYQDITFDEPYSAAKQSGRRQVGLFLLGILSDKDETKVFKMMQEARNASLEEETKYVNRNAGKQHDDEPRTQDGQPEYPFGIPKGGDVFDREDDGELGKFL